MHTFMILNGFENNMLTRRLVWFENSIYHTKLILDALKRPGQLVMRTKIHKTTRHSAMTTSAILQLPQPLQMINN